MKTILAVNTAVCAGLVILFSPIAQGQNLFVSDFVSANIYEFTPNGGSSTFASGLGFPTGLAFDNAGNLFVADYSGNI